MSLRPHVTRMWKHEGPRRSAGLGKRAVQGAVHPRMNIEAARQALREPGRRSWPEVKAELALHRPAV